MLGNWAVCLIMRQVPSSKYHAKGMPEWQVEGRGVWYLGRIAPAKMAGRPPVSVRILEIFQDISPEWGVHELVSK